MTQITREIYLNQKLGADRKTNRMEIHEYGIVKAIFDLIEKETGLRPKNWQDYKNNF